MDQKRRANFVEDEITAMVEEIEGRQHVLFGGLNSGLTNKAKQVSWECCCCGERGGAARQNCV